jgi:excisionase family DNA binding protein
MDDLMTVPEIAESLKLDPTTVWKWVDEGKLPSVRVEEQVKIKREDFERFLDEGDAGKAIAAESERNIWDGDASGAAPPPAEE